MSEEKNGSSWLAFWIWYESDRLYGSFQSNNFTSVNDCWKIRSMLIYDDVRTWRSALILHFGCRSKKECWTRDRQNKVRVSKATWPSEKAILCTCLNYLLFFFEVNMNRISPKFEIERKCLNLRKILELAKRVLPSTQIGILASWGC